MRGIMRSFLRRLKRLHDNRYIGMYLYRLYKYNLYTKLTSKPRIEHICTNKDGVKYELVYKKEPKIIKFNSELVNIKKYNENRCFVWLPNIDGKLEIDNVIFPICEKQRKQITEESIIIVSDRYEKADDNGEFFYEWISKNKREYKNVYFAISKSSTHYSRLENKGFKLLNMDSKKFRDKYEKADVVVSSVYSDYIENHKQLRYKRDKTPSSKFIFLQHGVVYRNSDVKLNSKQKINLLNISTFLEEELMKKSKIWFKQQINKTGMSRIETMTKSSDEKYILYSPTWTSEAFNSNDVRDSILYRSIQDMTKSKVLLKFLKCNKIKLKIIIHPQLCHDEKQWITLEKEFIEILLGQNINYTYEISNSLFYVTDISSTFFDAIFRGIPVAFYQPDARIINDMGFKYSNVAPVVNNNQSLVELFNKYITNNGKQEIDSLYKLDNAKHINERIWELVVNG